MDNESGINLRRAAKSRRQLMVALGAVLLAGTTLANPRQGSGTAAESAVAAVAERDFATYSWLRRNVFPLCMYCHISVPGVSFGRYEDTMKHVVAGKPELSRLYLMVVSRRMPKGRGGLPEEQIRALHDWIKNGARND